MKNETKRKIGLVALLVVMALGLFAPAMASEFSGTFVYSAVYNQKLDYDGYYYSDILKFSDLSTENSKVATLFIVEKPNLIASFPDNFTAWGPYGQNLTVGPLTPIDGTQENGLINATISYQYSNGTTAQETYSKFYDFALNPEPLNFTVWLTRGDTALISVYKGELSTNITRLQIIKDTGNALIEKKIYPSLDSIAESFNGIVASEGEIFGYVVEVAKIGLFAFYIIVAPVLIILLIMWGIRKIKESAGKG
jgi:hypothetical protein